MLLINNFNPDFQKKKFLPSYTDPKTRYAVNLSIEHSKFLGLNYLSNQELKIS